MKIQSQKNFLAGLLFAALGTAFATGAATSLTLGSAERMGSGYFPLLVSALLALLGLLLAATALLVPTADGDPVGRIAWKPLSLVIAANLLFGVVLGGLPALGLPPLGLVPAIYVLVLVAALAGKRFRLRNALWLATVLAIGCYLVFVRALSLQFQVWPAFLTS